MQDANPNRPSDGPAQDFFGEPFWPRRVVVGGHAQTIVGNFLPRRNELPPPEASLMAPAWDELSKLYPVVPDMFCTPKPS